LFIIFQGYKKKLNLAHPKLNQMKKNLLFSLLILLSVSNKSYSQCSETNETKILLVGDSWAYFMGVDQTINTAFRYWGHSNYRYITNSIVSENGARTNDFLKPEKQNEIQRLLDENPSIKAVHLSLGGNDVLGEWKKSFTQAQTDSLKDEVFQRLLEVITFIKSARPGITVLWSGYVYTNFEEIISTSGLGSNHPFYNTWQKMEFPSNIEINTILNDFSDIMEIYVASDPQLKFVIATGLMQYTFGQGSPLGVAPGGTYPAYSAPLPYGYPNYPSPRNSMRDYPFAKDCFHLSPKGYLDLIQYHTQKFYHKFLMDDLFLLAENNNQSASVSSNGNVSDTLFMGEKDGERFSTVLSFNTTSMMDTSISKASIFLRRESLTGNNPIGGNLVVKVKSGHFGSSATVEAEDFNAADDGSGTPCLFGANNGDARWIRLDLPVSLYPFIQKNEPTQFIVSAPASTSGIVRFNNSSDPDFAPVLNLVYGSSTLGLDKKSISLNSLKIYPNPLKDILNLDFTESGIMKFEVIDLLGRYVPVKMLSDNIIDVSGLPAGVYILSVITNEGIASQRFIKQ
jgi:lysophospholipase L1-like esterase